MLESDDNFIIPVKALYPRHVEQRNEILRDSASVATYDSVETRIFRLNGMCGLKSLLVNLIRVGLGKVFNTDFHQSCHLK